MDINGLTHKWMGFVGVITDPCKLELFQPCLLLVTEPAQLLQESYPWDDTLAV